MKIKHVTIQTGNLEQSVEFYEKTVGLKIQKDMRGGDGADIVFLADEPGETCIELIENKERAYSGDGISIGFATDDVEAKRNALIAEGYEVTPLISPNPHVKFFFVKDPSGVQVQFI